MTTIKELTVFRACPMKDTEVERQTLAEVIDLANEIAHGARLPVRLRPVTWEQAPPGMHPDGAQGRINETLQPTECDVLVGIFRSWFGVAEADGRTPTEGEILDALDAWKRNGKPDIKVYFGPTSVPSSNEEGLQIERVSNFKETLAGEGLYGEYRNNDQFRSFLIRDLLLVLNVSAKASSRDKPEETIEAFIDCEPTMLRADGAAERAGDVKITLAGPPVATGAECVFDIDVYTSPVVNVTSALLTGDLMEATAVQEIAPGDFGRPIHGRRRGANHVEFRDVVIHPHGAGRHQRLAITNLRVNASQFGTPEDQVAEASAIVVLRPASSTTPAVPILQTPVVGIVKPAVAFSPVFRDGTAPQFTRQNLACLDGGMFAFKLRFAELALCALKTVDEERNRTGVAPESEIRLARGEVIGRPAHICGTRLMIRFCNVPSGLRVLVTPRDVDGWALADAHGSPRAILTRSNPDGDGGYFVQESIPIELPIFGGTCQAVWEWVAPRTVPAAKRAVEFGVFLQVAGGPVGIGKASVNGCLAPISNATGASFIAPVPRFVDNAANRNRTAFEVVS